ncbi:MAG: hypothetical protein RMZ69_10615 [Nostoc sp. ChiQUE01a]|nr:hypothetical protein [Nostoc sp. ChiQUE01a]
MFKPHQPVTSNRPCYVGFYAIDDIKAETATVRHSVPDLPNKSERSYEVKGKEILS